MYTYIDLFAGCGGLSEGFEQAGNYKGIAHVEWDRVAAKTLTHRLRTKWKVANAAEKVIVFDIQKASQLIKGTKGPESPSMPGLKSLIKKSESIDLLIGGPPCQAYSVAGRIRDENGMRDDYRNYLFESYVEIMSQLSPDIFVFENVPGILTAAPGGTPIIDRIHRSFTKAGYTTLDNFRDALFNLDDFGIPQKRARIIIIGLKNKTYDKSGMAESLLINFYKQFRQKYTTSKKIAASEALDGLTKFFPSDLPSKKNSHLPASSEYLNHAPRFHNIRDIEIFEMLTKDIESGSNVYASTASLKKLYTEKTGKESAVHKYHVIRPNLPSNTIPAHLYKDGLRHIHWDSKQARSITVREAARLQTFPDDFEFLGSMGDQYRMIGNAVPPKFANLIASELQTLLNIRS